MSAAFQDGLGVERDVAEAVRLYTLAAEQGNAIAQYNLGDCYKVLVYADGVDELIPVLCRMVWEWRQMRQRPSDGITCQRSKEMARPRKHLYESKSHTYRHSSHRSLLLFHSLCS